MQPEEIDKWKDIRILVIDEIPFIQDSEIIKLDRQLKQYPNVDFSLPETRQEYTDFGIDTYRYTKDDPNFDANLIDQFSREIEQDLNDLGFEVVERD